MNAAIKKYMAQIGRKGGKASRRQLTPEQARAMQLKSAKSRSEKAKRKQ